MLTYCVVVFVVVVAKCDLFVYITGYFESICSNFGGWYAPVAGDSVYMLDKGERSELGVWGAR